MFCSSKGSSVPSSLGAPAVAVAVPRNMSDGQQANWAAAWESGVRPFTIDWDFGGGAQNIGPIAATSPDHQSPVMINEDSSAPAQYTYTVTVQDSSGEVGYASGLYEVASYLNSPPQLDVSYSDRVLMVMVHDADGDDVTVSLDSSAGITGDPQSVVVTGGGGRAEFYISGGSLFEAASGTVTVTADDGHGGVVSETVEVSIAALVLADDVVYVIPLKHHVKAGDQVRFICATGAMANPFRYLNCVSVVLEDDAEFVPESFNVGELGRANDYPDGIWPNVGVDSFLLSEELIQGVYPQSGMNIPAGRRRWSFNVTGIGGTDLAGGTGVLFNFAMTFGTRGEKHVGLQKFDVVNRTYYSDGASHEYFWGGLMADVYGSLNVEGVDNTIMVE